MKKARYNKAKRMAEGYVIIRHKKAHWWIDVKSNSTLGMWHNIRFDPDPTLKDWRKQLQCTCAWVSTFGLDKDTGLLTKPCIHMIACMMKLNEYGYFKEEIAHIEQETFG